MSDDADLSEFERRTREALRASADNLDGAMRSRLTQARYAALDQAARKPAAQAWNRFAPWGAVAIAALLVTAGYVGRERGIASVNHEAGTAFYDVELLADNDAYSLSEESDYDFIAWAASMGEQDPAGT